MNLHGYLDSTTQEYPNRTAVEDAAGGTITFRELSQLADRLRDRLVHLGVQPGDRVGIYMKKSIDAVASIFGILKSGAAYVPVDPSAPPSRNGYILGNCEVKAVLVEKQFAPGLRAEFDKAGASPPLLELGSTGAGKPLGALLDREQATSPAGSVETSNPAPDSLAYILYTSGSTGMPKGVIITHRNATSFVDWCSEVFQPSQDDRFSSHAPFHFDLSILDIYTSLKHGATLVLVDDEVGKKPGELAPFIEERRITIWYSAPSILSLLAQFGDLETRDYSNLRMVLFAGEVFPVVHLRALKKLVPHPRYFNLYGPTETNVCTFYEVPSIVPDERTDPYPIGGVCSHLEGIVVDTDGRSTSPGTEGELCIRGPSVTQGYWDLPDQTANAFFPAESESDAAWYRTGDLVVAEEDGDYVFMGRRDRMVKKRGYRVELGEIESCLYRHPDVLEAAVVALPDEAAGIKIRAHLTTRDNVRLSLIKMKRFCSEQLPLYMIPDLYTFHPSLPKTSTDKIDYQTLKNM